MTAKGRVPKAEMEAVLQWTKDRLAAGDEAPWDWFRLMKLQEVLIDILEKSTLAGRNIRLIGKDDPIEVNL